MILVIPLIYFGNEFVIGWVQGAMHTIKGWGGFLRVQGFIPEPLGLKFTNSAVVIESWHQSEVVADDPG